MVERPQRYIYVSIDGKIYKLLFSMYGLDDAPRLFTDELSQYLKSGDYFQSQWDSCIFIKWASAI